MAGQVVKRGERNYTVRVYLGRDGEGKRKYLNHTVKGSKKDAEKVLNKMLRDKDLGVLVGPSYTNLDEFLDHWLEAAARPRLRPRTFNELYSSMLARGLSARTVRLTHTIFSNALDQAVKWRMMPFNPADAVDLPKQQKQEMHAMSKEEASRFMKASEGDRWHVLFMLLLTTGLRPSEAIALKWTDLDLAADRLSVRRTLKKVKGKWLFEAPKTKSSTRTIDLPPSTTRLLADLERDGELVFTNGEGEPVGMRCVTEEHFKPILRRAGLLEEIRLYDLRHTHATLLLIAGVHPKVVSERLGHSSIQITLDTYSHVLPNMQKESAAKLEAMLFTEEDEAEEPLYN